MAVQIPLEAPIGVYVDTDEPSFCHTSSVTPHPGSSISEIPSGSWEESVFVVSLCWGAVSGSITLNALCFGNLPLGSPTDPLLPC